MNQEPTYHIDVTPEEDALFRDNTKTKNAEKFVPNTFKKIFCLVLGVHVLIGAVIVMSSSTAKAAANKPPANFTEPISEVPIAKTTPVVKQDSATKPEATPAPAPKPQTVATNTTKSNETQNKPLTKQQTSQHSNEKFVKEYTIKQGDTITSIAKKYKLSTQRLIKINNIKDVNKIQVGQKIKFM